MPYFDIFTFFSEVDMSLILTIETATDVCSVALFDGEKLLDFRENTDGKSHATLLTVFIDDILRANNLLVNQLSAVSISMGPGSYTGLRIGVSAAKGLCYGAGIPLLAINTLQVITESFLHTHAGPLLQNELLCPMIDARRQEVYTAFFDTSGNEISQTSALIVDEGSFGNELLDKTIYFFGNGSNKCQEIIKHPGAKFVDGVYPSARYMGKLSAQYFMAGKFQDVAYFEPFYLKDFVATTPKNKVI